MSRLRRDVPPSKALARGLPYLLGLVDGALAPRRGDETDSARAAGVLMSILVMSRVWDSYPGAGSELLALLALADAERPIGRAWLDRCRMILGTPG